MNAYDFLTDIIEKGEYGDCAKQAHETWKATKESQGWRYGPERDNQMKTNPLMVPLEELSPEYRGQNSLTPYAVVNFFRVQVGEMPLEGLENMLADVADQRNPTLVEQMSEYVHSHFIAAQLAQGMTVRTRNDLGVYEKLDADTKSWDTQSALGVVNYLRDRIANYGGG